MTTLTKPRKVLWGGVIEFGDLEPGKYTATAEAWNAGENILEGSGSTEITVRAGETTDCNITMILEGETAYYSKYCVVGGISVYIDGNSYNRFFKYSYPALNNEYSSATTLELKDAVEDSYGNIYYLYVSSMNSTYMYLLTDPTNDTSYIKRYQYSDYSKFINSPLYYDSKTDSLWLASFESNLAGKFVNFSVFENPAAATSNTNPSPIGYDDVNYLDNIISCQAFAVKEDNIYIAYNNSNILLTKKNNSSNTEASIPLSNITPALSGEVTDMAVLEDGTVAVLVRSVGVGTETEGFDNMSLKDKGTVYSRGALVLLSSDLSKVEKVLGWTDSQRTINATNVENAENDVTKWTSIEAYIPEYEERGTHFYGPMRIVAIRPKELVIADCGANFVLPDYYGKKNGKIYAHNRLMTVNLRNFAIGCKKEFSESELKFKNLVISGGIEATSASPYGGNYVDEK